MSIKNIERVECSDKRTYTADIPLKKLLKRLDKGLNIITLSTGKGDERITAETMLDFEV